MLGKESWLAGPSEAANTAASQAGWRNRACGCLGAPCPQREQRAPPGRGGQGCPEGSLPRPRGRLLVRIQAIQVVEVCRVAGQPIPHAHVHAPAQAHRQPSDSGGYGLAATPARLCWSARAESRASGAKRRARGDGVMDAEPKGRQLRPAMPFRPPNMPRASAWCDGTARHGLAHQDGGPPHQSELLATRNKGCRRAVDLHRLQAQEEGLGTEGYEKPDCGGASSPRRRASAAASRRRQPPARLHTTLGHRAARPLLKLVGPRHRVWPVRGPCVTTAHQLGPCPALRP